MTKVNKVTNVVLSLFVALLMMSWAVAEDWSQFRGPNGSGVSSSTGLPIEFGRGKNLLWQTALPAGHSSPVLTRDRIFVTAHTNEKENYKLLVMCLDRQTGKVLWQREVPRVREPAACRTSTGPPRQARLRTARMSTSSFRSSDWYRLTEPEKRDGSLRSVRSICSTVSARLRSWLMTK